MLQTEDLLTAGSVAVRDEPQREADRESRTARMSRISRFRGRCRRRSGTPCPSRRSRLAVPGPNQGMRRA